MLGPVIVVVTFSMLGPVIVVVTFSMLGPVIVVVTFSMLGPVIVVVTFVLGFGCFLEAAVDHAFGHDGNAAHNNQKKHCGDRCGTPRGLYEFLHGPFFTSQFHRFCQGG
jgi:hypothetical protein